MLVDENAPERRSQGGRQVVLLALCLLIALLSCLSSEDFWGYLASVIGFFSLEENPFAVYFLDHPDLGHVVAYGLLTLLLYSTLKTRHFLLPPVIAFSFGLLMEAAQLLVPSRGSNWSDLGWNLLGIGGAMVVFLVARGERRKVREAR